MLNLNKYSSRSAYNSGSRPANEDCVSLAGNEVIYDGVNVILKKHQVCNDAVCLVFWDNTDSEYVFVPVETYVASKFDTTRYTIQNFVRFGNSMGRQLLLHGTEVGWYIWAEFNRYKLECTTSASGGFTWSVVINGTTKSGTVSWSAGASLDSIVTQLNQGAVNTYLVFSHSSGENFIRIKKGGYSYSVFTISSVTGATLTDLSLYTKINGVQQAQSHRDWQTQDVASLFPSSGFMSANTVQYARNGYNLSYMCGGNLSRYKTYYDANGATSYVAESSIAARMKSSTFSALNGSGVAEQQALYDKYNGSWNDYMAGSMIQIDDEHKNGIEYQSYNNADTQSAFLASVTTMDFDGTYIPAFPSAYRASLLTDTRGALQFGLPTNHEIALFMEDSQLAKINSALSIIGGNALSITGYYWSGAQYYSGGAWLYYCNYGRLDYTGKYGSYSARSLAYLD